MVKLRRTILFSLLLILVAFPYQSSADPLDNWHWRNPLPQGNNLNDVIYADNMFVAVGDFGSVVTSSDGINWAAQPSVTDSNLRAITNANGIYVAVADGGKIFTSWDGKKWNTKDLGSDLSLSGIAYGNGMFLAVGAVSSSRNATAYISTDGVEWVRKFSGDFGEFYNVTFGKGIFVAISNAGGIFASADGIIWEQTSLITALTNVRFFSNGVFVAVGDNSRILISSDGRHWTQTFSNTGSFLDRIYFKDITHGNSMFEAIGFAVERNRNVVLTSFDGVDWQELDLSVSYELNALTYGSKAFVSVGKYGAIFSTSDGENWTQTSKGVLYNFNSITAGNGTLVAAGGSGLGASTDGVNWHNTNYDAWLAGVAYGNNSFVAVGNAYSNGLPFSIILTSSDGMTWEKTYSDPDPWKINGFGTYLRGIAYGNEKFVAIARGKVLLSYDGKNWNEMLVPFDLYGITYGKDIFVAVGDQIVISEDGFTWTEIATPDVLLYSISYGNGLFIAVGGNYDFFGYFPDYRGIYTSPDGLTWSKNITEDGPFINVSYGYQSFVAVDGASLLLTGDG